MPTASDLAQTVCASSQRDHYAQVRDDLRTESYPDGTYGVLFRSMFEPSPQLADYIAKTTKELGLKLGTMSLSAQIRSAYPLKTNNKSNPLIRPTMEMYPETVKKVADNAVDRLVTLYVDKFDEKSGAAMPPIYATADQVCCEVFDRRSRFSKNASTIVILGLDNAERHHMNFDVQPAEIDEAYLTFFASGCWATAFVSRMVSEALDFLVAESPTKAA